MKRFECLKILSSMIDPKTIVVANIGPISREWNALRTQRGQSFAGEPWIMRGGRTRDIRLIAASAGRDIGR